MEIKYPNPEKLKEGQKLLSSLLTRKPSKDLIKTISEIEDDKKEDPSMAELMDWFGM